MIDPDTCPRCRRGEHSQCIGAGAPGALSTRACSCASHEACPAELRSHWDEFAVDVYCEREEGHEGPHSSGEGQWEW